MRVCTHCKIEKPFSDFHKHSRSKSGYREVCKSCRKKLSQDFHKKKDLQSHALQSIKARAKDKKLPFNLEYSDITPPETCPVFGFKLNRHRGKMQYDSPSVDKIVPELGYVKGNIQIISELANRMKQDATEDQLRAFAIWILKDRKT